MSATIRTARSRSSGGYLLDEPPDMTPSFPRTGVSGHAGAVHDLARVRPEYYTWDSAVEADGLEWFTVHPGPILDLAMHSRYRAIRAYLDNGMNVIADDVIWTREWLVDALRVFEGCRVWMVGVHVSDEEGARRELERGDRHPGWNRGSARAAHADAEYDFELDTTATPVHELARELHESYQACPYPMAFNRLRKRFLS
ncbi:phosphotransferase-like protein [Mycobacterium tuberculosis]